MSWWKRLVVTVLFVGGAALLSWSFYQDGYDNGYEVGADATADYCVAIFERIMSRHGVILVPEDTTSADSAR